MAALIELLPREYGFVAIVLVLYCFLNFYMAFQVGKARKKYKVFYPTLYASESENKDAKLFNCVQRGHQHSPETMPIFFMLMIVGGLKHPSTCAALGMLYTVARYFYFTGYSTGEPNNRLKLTMMIWTVGFQRPRRAFRVPVLLLIDLLPKEYAFLTIVLVLYCFLNFGMAFDVSKARNKYKVFYPTLYASESENKDAKLFNCIQRGHQNSLETMPIFFMLIILGGLKHPSLCAAVGMFYTVARYFYFKGYSTGEPKNRLKKIGAFCMPSLLVLMLFTLSFGWSLLNQPASS